MDRHSLENRLKFQQLLQETMFDFNNFFKRNNQQQSLPRDSFTFGPEIRKGSKKGGGGHWRKRVSQDTPPIFSKLQLNSSILDRLCTCGHWKQSMILHRLDLTTNSILRLRNISSTISFKFFSVKSMIKCFFKAVSAQAPMKPNVLFIKKNLDTKKNKITVVRR
jgi:hypothetical protein